MWQAKQVEFSAGSDVVVIGCNPENADMDNPRGDIFGQAFYVVASNARGDTRVLAVGTTGRYDDDGIEAKADRLAAALTARAASGRLPVGFDGWSAGRAVYGSDAYVAYGADDDIACERMEG